MKTENVRLWLTVALILRGVAIDDIPAAVKKLEDTARDEERFIPFTDADEPQQDGTPVDEACLQG